MTNKNEAPDPDELAAQFRPAWETGESDTITSSAPRPIERITAQPRTDEDPTVKPVQMTTTGEEPTLPGPVLEDLNELTEVDRKVPVISPPAPSGAPPESGNFAVKGAPLLDMREMVNSDPEEMALSPMRPRAITVPIGFVAKAEPAPRAKAPQQQGIARPPVYVSEDRNRPTADVVLRDTRRPVRIVFAAMGGLVLLIGLGVIVKAALGSGSTTEPARVEPARAEATHAEPARADPEAQRPPKNDIPPPPAEESMAAEPPSPPASAAPTPPKPIAASRPPVTPPSRPLPPRPPAGGAGRPPPKPPKGGIVRDTPF